MKDLSKLYDYSDGGHFKGKSTSEVFEEISISNNWIEKESISGFGSSLKQTSVIINKIPKVLGQFKIGKLLDIPCGDFNWMKELNLSRIAYMGGDIVKSIVDKNNTRYSSSSVSFTNLDLMKDDLGVYDMLFCRDCLVHFSYIDIQKALKNIKRSAITYLMMTTFPEERVNKDIVTGGWRPLNFELEPFNFRTPLYLLNEECTEMEGAFKDKSLGVWRIEDL